MALVPRRSSEAGFTIIDTLVATAISLTALAAFASFNVAQLFAMRDQTSQVDLQSTARNIADLFAREARRAGLGTNVACIGTVSTGVLIAQSTQVRFRADLDGNGILTGANEDVTYTLDTTNKRITRRDNGTAARTDILWSGTSITGSQLTYFDGTGAVLDPGATGLTAAQLLAVRRIRLRVALTMNTPSPRDSLQQTASNSADAELRNRHFATFTACNFN